MSHNAPFEVISAPGEIWVAPAATTFPDLDDAPGAAGFTLVGTSGSKSITEPGITVRHMQTIETDAFRSLGGTGPVGAARPNEDLEIEFTLMDISATEYARALDPGITVTDTAPGSGVPGTLNFPLIRGAFVTQQAVLVRFDVSPEETSVADDFKSQLEVPRMVQVATPAPVFVKAAPAMLLYIWRAIEDPADGFGKLRFQDEAPT